MFKMILIDFFFPCSSLAKQKRNETKTWVMPTRCDMHTVVVYYATYWRHGMKGEHIGFKTKLFPSLNLISVWNFVIFQSSLSVPWKKILLVKQNFIFFLVAWALKVSIYFITDHRIWFNCPCTNLTPFYPQTKSVIDGVLLLSPSASRFLTRFFAHVQNSIPFFTKLEL